MKKILAARIVLTGLGLGDELHSIVVDDESFDLKGRTLTNEEAGTTSIETSLAPADPLFAALQKADRFKIEIPGHEQIYPLTDADVAGLLRLCAKP